MKKKKNLLYFVIAAIFTLALIIFVIGYVFFLNPSPQIQEIGYFNDFIKLIETKQISSVVLSKTKAFFFTTAAKKMFSVTIPNSSYIVDLLINQKIPVKLSDNSILVTNSNYESNISIFLKSITRIISSLMSVIFFFPIFFSMNKGALSSDDEINSNNMISFQDVIGMRREKYELQEVINLINSSSQNDMQCQVPKGVLLSGPPGNGKTYLAKACAGECKGQFLFASASEFIQMYVGVGPARVRKLFNTARSYDGFSIIYIDEIDALGSRDKHSSQSGGASEYQATINQLLVEMDGFDSKEKILVILSTNQPESLDKALIRSGRVDRKISVENPRLFDRELLIEHLLKNTETALDVNSNRIAKAITGFSRADITTLVNEAKLYALRENSKVVNANHFELAKDRMMLGIEKDKSMSSKKELYNTAYHEIGHAFMICKYEKVLSPLYKITILPRGQALGVTIREGKESVSETKEELEANIMVALAGRACEIIFFGNNNLTSGCSSDLNYAKQLAERYVIYGMDESYGVGFINMNRYHSDRQNDIISYQSDALINHLNKRTMEIIKENKALIGHCAEVLYQKETLTGQELKSLIENIEHLPVIFSISQSVSFN